MKKFLVFFPILLLTIYSCKDDESAVSESLAVSFAVPSANLTDEVTDVVISFSKTTPSAGTITLGGTETEA